MPFVPNPDAPFDLAYTILAAARTRLNDTLPTLFPVSGKLLDNSQTSTNQLFNNAYRKLQEFLANLGYTKLIGNVVITGLPPVASTDPGTDVWIDWFNYFDGSNLWQLPVLPQDLIIPKRVWERQSGMNAMFCEMGMYLDGLPTWNKQARNLVWEWRGDAIHMPGSQATMDLRIRYARYLPDIVDTGSVPWFQQPVPIMRCMDSLSYFLCSEVLEARGDDRENPFMDKAVAAAKLIMNRDISTMQRVNVRRRPRSGRGEGSQYGGGLWC